MHFSISILLQPDSNSTHSSFSGLTVHGSSDPDTPSIISGGIEIAPDAWTTVRPAACAGCQSIVKATLQPDTNFSRQLFVNQTRANWTSALFPSSASEMTATGYHVTAASGGSSPVRNLTHNGGKGVEMVYRGTGSAGAQWTESRTPVQSVNVSTGMITMAVSGYRLYDRNTFV